MPLQIYGFAPNTAHMFQNTVLWLHVILTVYNVSIPKKSITRTDARQNNLHEMADIKI